MTNTTVTVRIRNDDKLKLRKECKQIFLDHNPKLKELVISDAVLLNRIINYYITN